MARRFRSQPQLQRSRGASPRLISLVGAVAVVAALGAVLARTASLPPPARAPELFPAAAPGQTLVTLGEPAYEAAGVPGPGTSPLPEATSGSAPNEPAPSQPTESPAEPAVRAEAPTLAPQPRIASAAPPPRPANARSPQAEPTDEARWERQQRDYDRALRDYQARERREGYRWARQNGVTMRRYCQSVGERRNAFMEGCLDYIRTGEG